jgi:hypothetical protein
VFGFKGFKGRDETGDGFMRRRFCGRKKTPRLEKQGEHGRDFRGLEMMLWGG